MDKPLVEMLSPETIELNLKGKTKQEVIDELIHLVNKSKQILDIEKARDVVIARERRVSTGLEMGVAVPHHGAQSRG